MKRWIACVLLSVGVVSAQPVGSFDMEFVTIGDAGNPGWNREEPTGTFAGRGAVGYEYRITEREVETRDWIEFANTFAPQSDELSDFIGRPARWGATLDLGYAGPGDRYVLRTDLASPERQHIRVDWRQASYFVNWLHNGRSSDPSALMNGAYDVSTYGLLPDGVTYTDQTAHHPDAKFWIPTVDEWTKAGHWDPDKHGEDDGGWWIYNHGSDEPAVSGLPGDPGAQTAAIDLINNPDAIDRIVEYRNVPNGSYPDTRSPWGLIDMTGGAGEWMEDWSPSQFEQRTDRVYSGSENGSAIDADIAYFLNGTRPTSNAASFRIASAIPTPGVGVIVLLGGGLASCTRSVRK